MQIEATKLSGLAIIAPKVVTDERGFFEEVLRGDKFKKAGLPEHFVQVNHTRSRKNVLRGLHFQWDKPLGKLIRIINGSAWMAIADIRKKSPTFGEWFSLEVSSKNKKMVYAPPGFATGFCVPGDAAEVEYFYTEFYNPAGESGIIWNDQRLKIGWPVANPVLSERDKSFGTLAEWAKKQESNLF
jgi:dTDP-4-dehydrorhamnose 3,5-epimerase